MLENNVASTQTLRNTNDKLLQLSLGTVKRSYDEGNASLVPNSQELIPVVEPLNHAGSLQTNITNSPLKIYHPRMAPSAVTAENFIEAKALMSAHFIHNVAATKAARVSNLYRDPPRFENVIDIFG